MDGGGSIETFSNDLMNSAYIPPDFMKVLQVFLGDQFGPILSKLGPKKADELMSFILIANDRSETSKLDKAVKQFTDKYGGNGEIFGRVDELMVSMINSIGKRLGKPLVVSALEKRVNEQGRSEPSEMNENLQLIMPKSL